MKTTEERKLGWQKNANNEWSYNFSDCTVTEQGIQYTNTTGAYSLGFETHFLDHADVEKIDFRHLITVMEHAPKETYPVFIMNLAALLYPVLQCTHAQGPNLWIYGAPGSGKTELAMNFGTFVNRDKFRAETESIFAANATTKILIRVLQQHQGLNLILDDVKKERVSAQRDKWRRNVDTLLRSVFAFRLTDPFASKNTGNGNAVNAGAIVTGEIVDLERSTMTRTMFLNIENFIDTSAGSEVIEALQENPEWLVGAMVGIIRFLACQWNMGGVLRFKERFQVLAREERPKFRKSSGQRPGNTSAMMLLCHEILHDYAKKIGVYCSLQAAELSRVVVNTEDMIASPEDILDTAFHEVVLQLNADEAKYYLYDSCYVNERCLEYGFLMPQDKEAIYIGEIGELPGLETFSCTDELLLVRRDTFLEKMEDEMEKQMEKLHFSNLKLKNNLLQNLHNRGMIKGKKRPDKLFDYCIWYPENSSDDDKCQCLVLNTKHPDVKAKLNLIKVAKEDKKVNVDNLSYREQCHVNANALFKYSDCRKTIRKAVSYQD